MRILQFQKSPLIKLIYSIIIILIPIYILVNDDFRIVFNDGEPDYMANFYGILNYLIPLNNHHPGTITYYLYSLILLILEPLKLELSSTIILLRFLFLSFGLTLIFYLLKKNVITYLIFLIFFFAFPYIKWVYLHIGPEPLLLPLIFSFIFWYKKERNPILVGLFFGIMLNIKFNVILILPFILIDEFKSFEKSKRLSLIFLFSFISFTALSLPVIFNLGLPFYRVIDEIYGIIFNILYYKSGIYELEIIRDNMIFFKNNLKILVLIFTSFFLITISTLIYYFRKLIFSLNLNKIYLYICFIAFIFFSFYETGNKARHFIPIIPFFCIYLNEIISKYNKNYLNYSIYFIFIVLLIINFKMPINYNDLKIDELIKNSKEKNFFIQESQFNSEGLFLTWGKFRYAKSFNIWPKRWISKYQNIEYLNVRNTDCDMIIKNESPYPNIKLIKIDNSFFYNKCLDDQIEEILKNNYKFYLHTLDIDSYYHRVLKKTLSDKKLREKKIKNIGNDYTEYEIEKI